ncbi:MAG: hypothetical protein HYX84_00460 [Chloroflexi bacterium]|nr:hypothetical protein [Chloroflexota bacterium]
MFTSNPDMSERTKPRGLFHHVPLGMNFRNHLIRELNSAESLRLAKDKAAYKLLLEANGVATPRTYHVVHDFTDMRLIPAFPDEFVIKPNSGMGGIGIILLRREGNLFVNPSGEPYSSSELKLHVRKILDGEFSGFIERDQAIIEERIFPSPDLRFQNKEVIGLPDIRVFCCHFSPVMAMLRYPTLKSKGRSNLARGALGIGIDMATGRITHVNSKKERKEFTFKEIGIPPSFVVPKWNEIKEIAQTCAKLTNIEICGVDIVLDRENKVIVLENNGRPGIEIQNINEASLLELAKGMLPTP